MTKYDVGKTESEDKEKMANIEINQQPDAWVDVDPGISFGTGFFFSSSSLSLSLSNSVYLLFRLTATGRRISCSLYKRLNHA